MPDQSQPQLPPWLRDQSFSPSAGNIASMTHQPEQPNPAQPYLDAARGFSQHGLTGAIPSLRQYMPGWLNTLGGLVQSPTAQDVFSTANVGGIPLLEAWKPAELALLNRMIQSDDFDPSKLPGRSPNAISQMVYKLTGRRPTTIEGYPVTRGAPFIASDKEKVDQIIQMMTKRNMTMPQMASALGISERSLRRYLNETVGISRRGQKWGDPRRIQDYKDMVSQGLSMEQMAKKLGTGISTVHDQLLRLRQEGHVDYAPKGGTRTPGMPSFKFQEAGTPAGDPEYENALLLFLQGLGRGR